MFGSQQVKIEKLIKSYERKGKEYKKGNVVELMIDLEWLRNEKQHLVTYR